MDKVFSVATLNIRGAGVGTKGSAKQVHIRRIFECMRTQPQVIVLQEHWLDEERCKKKARSFPYANGYRAWNPGIFNSQGSGRCRAGTGILLAKQLAPLVCGEGIVVPGRAQYITLQGEGNKTVTILAIYAPSSSMERAALWQKLVAENILGDHYMMLGDFNFVEVESDRAGSNRYCTKPNRREQASWSRLLNHLGLEDTWNSDTVRKES